MAVDFTRIFHECTFESGCSFIVKRSKGSELEKMKKIDDVTNFYNVWKKLETRNGRSPTTWTRTLRPIMYS